MCLQIGRIDHNRRRLLCLRRQSLEHPGKHAHFAPTLPAIVKRLGRTIFSWSVTPAQAIAIDENYAAQNTSIIDPRLAMALWKVGPEPIHLLLSQPEKITHVAHRQLRSVNHPDSKTASQLMGTEPNNRCSFGTALA